jgi:23S rRNA (cytosine1962-C5)-methyltransferase
MTFSDLPVVRLNPKAAAQAIRHGFPWVYENEVVTDRRTRALTPGTLAVLQDDARRDIGLVAVNPASKLFARMLDRDIAATIGVGWFRARIARALALRSRLYDTPFYRLIHAEADGLPGVVVDRFGDALVVQPNAAWAEVLLDDLVEALLAETGATAVVKNAGGRARTLEGLDADTRVLRGAVDVPVAVTMNGATYMADLLGGQKTGLFYDQRANHAFAARLAREGRVLDVFSPMWAALRSRPLRAGLPRRWRSIPRLPRWRWRRRGRAYGRRRPAGNPRGRCLRGARGAGSGRCALRSGDLRPARLRPVAQVARIRARAYEGGAAGGGDCRPRRVSRALFLLARGLIWRSSAPPPRAGSAVRGARRSFCTPGSAGPDHPQLPQLAESGYLKALFFRLDG